MENILVVGAGLVGDFIYKNFPRILHQPEVKIYSADIKYPRPSKGYHKACYDDGMSYLGDGEQREFYLDVKNYKQFKDLIKKLNIDLVIGAVPGHLGYQLLEYCIKVKVPTIDISFCPENPLLLAKRAKKAGVSLLVDMGLAPGMPGIILGHYKNFLKIKDMHVEVGGLPKNPEPPYFYKAPFSPIDVIEEYIRPARFKVQGEIVEETYPMLNYEVLSHFGSDNGRILTDGLRTLLITNPDIPAMREYTVRDIRHLQTMAGSLILGAVNPIETSKLLEAWKYYPGEEDVTLYRQELFYGNKSILYEMMDTGVFPNSSMARTTGFTAIAVALYFILFRDRFDSGIIPPDALGSMPGSLHFILRFLKSCGIKYRRLK